MSSIDNISDASLCKCRRVCSLSARGSDYEKTQNAVKRLNKTVAANRRKLKLTYMKKKVSTGNPVFVHLVNH